MTLIILTDDALLGHRIELGLAEHCPIANVIGRCYSVEAGMEAIGTLKPDVVLLDTGMPGAKKQNMLTMLTTAGFRVVAITTSKGLFRKLFRQGVPVVMTEPLDMALLAELIAWPGKSPDPSNTN